jgi:hypothetical protein
MVIYDVHSGRPHVELRSRSIRASGTTKELLLMKLHLKWSSVTERSCERMAYEEKYLYSVPNSVTRRRLSPLNESILF